MKLLMFLFFDEFPKEFIVIFTSLQQLSFRLRPTVDSTEA